ncbi:TraB/GumN family protein [Evansella halocellulosilytica]|uniref:TraB/GumN family protein n=1 Tax=Evansella halocellulosilytica TaxID=2011013 RepID=UPI000BB8E12A|nr:TraB/GumN family protein [Evansella halocellulosilytica]
MKNQLLAGIIFLFIFTLIGCTTATIEFSDETLEEAIIEARDIEGELTEKEAQSITSLDLSDLDIHYLNGIEELTNLEMVDLSHNQIEDFTPLLELEHLTDVTIIGNRIDEDEDSFQAVEELLENGVAVEYEDTPAFAETGPPSEGVFYKVEEGSNTVYLFGSIHVGMEDIYPLHENIESAFDEADYLAVEIDMTELNGFEVANYMSQVGMYQDGRSLSDVIPDDLFQDTVDILQAYQYDESMVDMLKPWYAATSISNVAVEEAGYSSDYGIDFYFIDRAKNNIDIIGLETVEDQMGTFDILSEDSQVAYLQEVIDDYDNMEEDMAELMDIWRTGDIDSLLPQRDIDENASEDYQEYSRALMDDRDFEMTEKIEDFLLFDENETYFVVVGALHLVGETSIVGLLEDRGYEIQEGIE